MRFMSVSPPGLLAFVGEKSDAVLKCPNQVDHILENYGKDDTITKILDTIELILVPVTNPDGYSPIFAAHNISLQSTFLLRFLTVQCSFVF